jgi:hypothetical protein
MTVCIMLGYRGTMDQPADLDAATKALRAAVAARGKKWKRVAPLFGFLSAGRELAVGVLLRKAPQAFDAPSYGFHGSRLSTLHPALSATLRSEAVDDHSEAIDGLSSAIDAIDRTLAPFGIRLEGRHPGSVEAGPRALLISVDGAAGALIHGGLSDASIEAPLQAWRCDYDGEPCRLVGVPLATVSAEQRINALPTLSPLEWQDQGVAQRRALTEAGVASTHMLLLATGEPTPTPAMDAAASESAALPATFALRSFADVRASFAALKPQQMLRSQTLDGISALAFDDLLAWPDGAVNDAVALLTDAPGPKQLTDAGTFLRAFPLKGAIGTWNAAVEGRMASSTSWAVLDVLLTPERDDAGRAIDANLALVQTTDGWVAVSWSGQALEGFRRVLGFDPFASSKTKWKSVSAFHGEGAS